MAAILLATILVLSTSTLSFAQEATSFEQLRLLVKPGDTVSLTDSTGNLFRGRIADLSTSSLRLLAATGPRDFSQADVLEIKQRRSDSLANGATYGAITGGVFGTLGAVVICMQEPDCGGWAASAVVLYTAMGAGIGVGVDALIIRQRTIFRTPGRSKLGVSPILSGEQKGIRVTFAF